MSYLRAGQPLNFFRANSKSYVFLSSGFVGGKSYPDFVEDYGDEYEDNPTFIDLLCNIIYDHTKDEDYCVKSRDYRELMGVLAKKKRGRKRDGC
jgi:hypothetical protein